jgi:hypothetical protein
MARSLTIVWTFRTRFAATLLQADLIGPRSGHVTQYFRPREPKPPEVTEPVPVNQNFAETTDLLLYDPSDFTLAP